MVEALTLLLEVVGYRRTLVERLHQFNTRRAGLGAEKKLERPAVGLSLARRNDIPAMRRTPVRLQNPAPPNQCGERLQEFRSFAFPQFPVIPIDYVQYFAEAHLARVSVSGRWVC